MITRHDTEVLEQSNLGANANNDRLFPRGRTIPPYVEFIKSETAPEPFLPTETAGADGLEASGTEYLLYWFAMPEAGTREVRFEALVGNDYEISVSEVYVASLVSKEANRPQDRNRATYFYRVAGSEGRVTDLSNLGWVGFDYGRQTGVTVRRGEPFDGGAGFPVERRVQPELGLPAVSGPGRGSTTSGGRRRITST